MQQEGPFGPRKAHIPAIPSAWGGNKNFDLGLKLTFRLSWWLAFTPTGVDLAEYFLGFDKLQFKHLKFTSESV